MGMEGKTLGPWRILAELGSGGMGTVYRAEGPEGTVALKIVHPHLLGTPGFFKRFLREGDIGRRIRHPNVVATYDLDQIAVDGVPRLYLAMEYVEGQTLRALLEELSPVPEELCRHIGREVARGLDAIHGAGAIHRDLKPENVLITRDHLVVKVMDLGVARLAEEAMRLSQTGTFAGSVHYASPEQFSASGDEIDGRSDLYTLGVILYELAAGVHPYPAAGFLEAMAKAVETAPRRLGEVNPQLSPFFEEVVHTLLAKAPGQRFPRAVDLLRVLEAGEEGEWWKSRAKRLAAAGKGPPRRIRIPRETAVYGREAEIERLRTLFRAARSGEGRVLLVEGEAGIGKSRLVDEFVGQLSREGEDFHFLFGTYPPGGAATAAGAFAGAFREHFGEDGCAARLRQAPLLVPAFDALLRGEPPPAGTEPLTKDSLQTCFVHSARSLAAERPAILLVEDLHFAPEEGRALFAALALAAPGHRLLLVGTSRPGLPDPWVANLERLGHASRLTLPRLGPKDLALLLKDAFHSDTLAAELGHQIALKSDGNPFFAFEIIRGLREGQFLAKQPDGTWVTTRAIRDLVVPSSVQDLVNARVADLEPAERDLLDLASCFGFSFDPGLVAEVAGVPRLAALKHFGHIERRHRLVRAEGRRCVFDHHQVQEALYGRLLPPLKEEYHAAIAETLAARPGGPDGPTAALIAEHFLRGADGDRALPFLDGALSHLEASWMNDAAVALADRALAAPGLLAGRERVRILLRKAGRLDLLGRREEQRATLAEAVSLADADGDLRLRAEARAAESVVFTHFPRGPEPLPALEETIALARQAGDARAEATATGSLGHVLLSIGRFDEARERYERCLVLARETGDRRAQGAAIGNAGSALLLLGRREEARERFEQRVAIARETGDRRGECLATGSLGNAFHSFRCYEEARTHYARALVIAREIGDRQAEAGSTGNLGLALADLGRLEEARDHCLAALSLAREIGYRRGEVSYATNLASVLLSIGALDDARTWCERALAVAREMRDPRGLSYALRGLAAVLREKGDAGRAATLLEEALGLLRRIPDRAGAAETLAELAVLQAEAGDRDGAARRFAEARDVVGEEGPPLVVELESVRFTGGEAASAAELLAGDGGRVAHRTLMRVRHLLFLTTGRREHLDEAARLLDALVAGAPADCREAMRQSVRLHREITAARAS